MLEQAAREGQGSTLGPSGVVDEEEEVLVVVGQQQAHMCLPGSTFVH